MRAVDGGLPVKLDLGSPDVRANPYPAYAAIRRAGGLCRIGPGSWGVTRYADVAALLRDPRLGSEFPRGYHEISVGLGPAASFLGRIVLFRDAPVHTKLRMLLGNAFSPAVVRELRPQIAAAVDHLVRPALAQENFDAVTEIAFPLPVMVMCDLMGIPADARDEVRPRAADLSRAFAAIVPQEHRAAADEAVLWLRNFIREILLQRRARPGSDLLSRLLAAEDHGSMLTEDEILDNAVFVFFAGFETTVNLLSAGFAALAANPMQQQQLRRNSAFLPRAIEEFLRIDPPIQGVARFVRSAIKIEGRILRPGRVVVLLLGSANRDERVFTDPDRLDICRDPNPHLSFSAGAHFCMGAGLARTEAQILFQRVLNDTLAFEGTASPKRQSSGIGSYSCVPIRISR